MTARQGSTMNGMAMGRKTASAAVLLLLSCWISGSATAYDSEVVSNLKRSRDALLSQRSEIMGACDRVASQIDQLQQKLDRLRAYLRDTDVALRDVDQALRNAN